MGELYRASCPACGYDTTLYLGAGFLSINLKRSASVLTEEERAVLLRMTDGFIEGMAQTAAGGCSNDNDWVNGGLGLNASSTEETISKVVKSSKNSLSSGSTASQYGTGYLACMYLGYLVNGAAGTDAASVAKGLDSLMNQMKQGKSLNEIVKDSTPYDGLADFQRKFGDAASAHFIHELLAATGSTGNGALVTGSYLTNDLLPDAAHNTNLFQLDTTNTIIKNTYPAGVGVFSVPHYGYVGSRTGGPGGNHPHRLLR